MASLCYINGNWAPSSTPIIHANDRGFRYGDGVFETIPVYNGKPYRLSFYLMRLSGGLQAIGINERFDDLPEIITEAITRNNAQNAMLRVAISRGAGGRGYTPDAQVTPTLLVEVLPATTPPESIQLYLADARRIPAQCLPVQHKLAQGLNSTLAILQAQEHGCNEALQLTIDGHIAEGSASNIIWQKGDALYTPALDIGVLAGITRKVIMEQREVHEVAEPLENLSDADAVIMCNSAWKALPVISLAPQGWEWNSAKLAAMLNQIINDDIAQAS